MTYPPQEGFPPPTSPPNATQPIVPFPPQPPNSSPYQPAPTPQPAQPYRPPEAQGRSTLLVALSIAAALLLFFSGLMLVLYLNGRGNLSDTKADLSDTRTDLTAQVKEQKALVAEGQAKLAQAEKRADDLNTQLVATKAERADLSAQHNVLVPCMRRIQESFDAAANGDSSGLIRSLRQARSTCDKAEIKVDS
jgi:uncharacterized protein HemX